MEAAAGGVAEFVGAGLARRLDRRGDASAGLGDFLIGCAGAAHGVLVGAGTAEDEMGVAIDQPGRDQPAFAIGNRRGGCRRAFGRPRIGDAPILRCHHAIVDQAERVIGHRCESGVRPKLLHLDSIVLMRHYV